MLVGLGRSLARVLVVLVPPVLLLAACEAASIVTSPAPAKCQLNVTAPANFVAEGGPGTVAVTAQPECSWTASTQTSWILDLSPVSGQGNGTVEFRTAPNTTPSPREGEIVINESRVRVSQDAVPCRFTLSEIEETVPATGGIVTVEVTALSGCSWTAKPIPSWITVTSGGSGNGNGIVTIRVDPHSGAARVGTVTIAGHDFLIHQLAAGATPPTTPSPAPAPPAPAPCTYSINPSSQSFPPIGGTGATIGVTSASTCAWTAISNVSWITVTSGATGTGNGSVGYRVGPNPGAARTGTITVAGHTFMVTQSALICTYTVGTTGLAFPQSGGEASVEVRAPELCSWTSSTSASWIRITSGTSGSGNGSVSLQILPNSGPARFNTVTIAGHSVAVEQGP